MAVASALCPTPVAGLLYEASQGWRPCRGRLTVHSLSQRAQGGALGQLSHWALPWHFLTLLCLLVAPPACTCLMRYWKPLAIRALHKVSYMLS